MPALIRRIHHAKVNNTNEVTIWGTGNPRREFLFVEDMAEAALFVHNLDSDKYQSTTEVSLSHINVGSGKDVSIKELAEIICEVVGYQGELSFDLSKPDGTMKKLSSCEKLTNLGWKSKKSLRDGIRDTYAWFLSNKSEN
jgi:nucleoside-diphosphate-sugar epimerase